MGQVMQQSQPHGYLSIIRRYVLDPVISAIEITSQERTEVKWEQDAFDAFKTRVEQIPTATPDQTVLSGPVVEAGSRSQQAETIRTAYEETVLDIPHYDDVYDESLRENVVAEYGRDLVELFRSSSSVSFTAYHKDALIIATKRRVREREEYLQTLRTEAESLTELRSEVTEILDNFDTNVIPSWERQQFHTQIESIISARQSQLDTQPRLAHIDGHNLCEYLYSEESWTYPVLTAVGRLLTILAERDRDEPG